MKRMGQRGISIVLSAGLLLSLYGCGSFPEMTDEQYNHVVEYSAGLLLKYSNNGVKKMTYLEPTFPVDGVDALPETAMLPEGETELPAALPDVAELPEGEDEEGMEGLLPEGEEEEDLEPDEGGDTVTITQGDKQTLANGVSVGYNGYAVYNYYPIELADVIISAELGHKLLVLSFSLENTTDEVQALDMVTEDPYFRIGINGVQEGRYRPTILSEDLSTLAADLEPGERLNACLVVEVDEDLAGNVHTISLYARYEGKTQTAILN